MKSKKYQLKKMRQFDYPVKPVTRVMRHGQPNKKNQC